MAARFLDDDRRGHGRGRRHLYRRACSSAHRRRRPERRSGRRAECRRPAARSDSRCRRSARDAWRRCRGPFAEMSRRDIRCSAASSVSAPIVACVFITSNSSVASAGRLQQHAIGNADFADVVQRAGQINQLDVFVVDLVEEFRLAGQLLGQAHANSGGRVPDGRRFRDRAIRPAWPERKWPRRAFARPTPVRRPAHGQAIPPGGTACDMKSSAPADIPSTTFCRLSWLVSRMM